MMPVTLGSASSKFVRTGFKRLSTNTGYGMLIAIKQHPLANHKLSPLPLLRIQPASTGQPSWANVMYRCKECKRYFNERTGTPFNFLTVPTDIVFQVLLCALLPYFYSGSQPLNLIRSKEERFVPLSVCCTDSQDIQVKFPNSSEGGSPNT